MEKDFEIINHTADVGIIAYGADVSQAFANAARALFSLITELDDVAEILHRDVELVAPDEESLLVEWLNELIFLFDTESIVFKRFDIAKLKNSQLKARSYGEKIDSSKPSKRAVYQGLLTNLTSPEATLSTPLSPLRVESATSP